MQFILSCNNPEYKVHFKTLVASLSEKKGVAYHSIRKVTLYLEHINHASHQNFALLQVKAQCNLQFTAVWMEQAIKQITPQLQKKISTKIDPSVWPCTIHAIYPLPILRRFKSNNQSVSPLKISVEESLETLSEQENDLSWSIIRVHSPHRAK